MSLFDEGNEFTSQARDALGISNQLAGIGAISSIATGAINWGLLKNEKANAKNQAAMIELQAEQRTNILLEQFNAAIGNAQYSATRRGVRAGEGSVKANIEASAKDLGTDTARAKREAKLKASTVRSQGKVNQRAGLVNNLAFTTQGLINTSDRYKKNKNLLEDLG